MVGPSSGGFHELTERLDSWLLPLVGIPPQVSPFVVKHSLDTLPGLDGQSRLEGEEEEEEEKDKKEGHDQPLGLLSPHPTQDLVRPYPP